MQQEIFSDGSSSGSAAAVADALSSAAAALVNSTAAAAAAANGSAAGGGGGAPPTPPGTWLGFLGLLVYRALQLVLLGGGFIVYNLWRNQERMLYHPQLPGAPGRRVEDNPAPYHSPLAPEWGAASAASGRRGIPYQEAFVPSSDGTPIHAWLLPAPPSVRAAQAPTLLLCHANAGNMGLRLPMANSLRAALSANIIMWDYRGYGASGGEPEEAGIKRDGEAVLAWARALPEVHPGRLFVVGESLGGAVAVHIAATAAAAAAGGAAPPLAGLWLINTVRAGALGAAPAARAHSPALTFHAHTRTHTPPLPRSSPPSATWWTTCCRSTRWSSPTSCG